MAKTSDGGERYFSRATIDFLRELDLNNRRDWFKANKDRYEEHVKAPALKFISDVAPHLKKISPHFKADARPVGGSLFRIYRDVRFSKDKSPYKTYVGIRFPHVTAKDVHGPGFYLHIDTEGTWMACGIWRPDSGSLKKIRTAIDREPTRWKRAKGAKTFREHYELSGDSLKRAPVGIDPEHRLIEDLRRKDFVGVSKVNQRTVTGLELIPEFTARCRAAKPFQRFLCDALGVEY
jgi:uncharacterized protein (TIGR02453 family)